MPSISVVIPVFNGTRFITEAIQSVWDQSYPALEIIVVDDGSTDDTETVVSRLSGPIPIGYHRQHNQGQAAARNRGVSITRGDWVALLDQDDVWYPQKLAMQADCIAAHPHVPFFYSSVDLIDETGQLLPPPRWLNKPNPLFQNLPSAAPSTVVFKKDLFLKLGGFNPRMRLGDDTYLFTRIALTSPIHHISRSLVKYRRHSAQTSKKKEIWADWWPLYHQCASELWRDDSRKLAILAKRSAAVYADMGQYYLRAGEYDKARHFCSMSFSLRPWFWSNLRRWGLSYLPGVREWYRARKAKPKGRMREQ